MTVKPSKMTDKQKELLFGSRMLTDHLNSYLLAQVSIVNGLIRGKLLNGRAKEIRAAIASMMNTAMAIAKLGESDEFYNECVMLARGFFERIVNICYLLVCDNDKFKGYRLHTKQKAYRRLDQEFYAGDIKMDLKFTGRKEPPRGSELDEALKKFSTKKGKEKRGWPDISISERIKLIGEKSNANIGIFLSHQSFVYTDASEALHGSFYGLTFHTWAYTPNIDITNKNAVEQNLQKNFTLLFWNSGELIQQLLVVLVKDNDISEALKYSTKNSNNSLEIMKAAMKESDECS